MSTYIPLLANFNSLFELSAALNLGYASIPQFSLAVQNIFHKRINIGIQKLKESEKSINAKVIVVKEEGSKDIFDKNVEAVMKEVKELDEEHKNNSRVLHSKLSSFMNPFFIVIAFFSIFYLYLAGIETKNNIFPIGSILTTFIAVIVLMVLNIILAKLTNKSDAIIIALFLIYVIVIAMFGELEFNDAILDFFNRELCLNIILISCIFPLLVTVIGYIVISFIVSHEFGSKIDILQLKLSQNEGVLDQVKSQDGEPEKMLQNMKEKK